ncbi:MAG: MBL fold metallo-hydrolase [Firmicutes bacterium]|nr:MBL fold metallo-hydrolase [Bacillota bacterium]
MNLEVQDMVSCGEPIDIGECASLKARVISEIGWQNNKILLGDIQIAGGMETSQYQVDWEEGNAAGYSALLESVGLDGKTHRILLDTGWDLEYIDRRFQEEGIDKLLLDNQIDFLFLSHEHMDHLWGLPATIKYQPDITIRVTSTLGPDGRALIRNSGHTGRLEVASPWKVYPLFPGCASVTFNMPIILRTIGEQALFFNIKDRGLVVVTGCCHMGIVKLLKFAAENIMGGDRVYGIFGGLHISPFDRWEAAQEEAVEYLAKLGIAKVGCHHCTGKLAVDKMRERGIAVVGGTGRFGSKSDAYLGNGDEIVF